MLAEIDRPAAELVRRWVTQQRAEALATVETLGRRVLGVDTFLTGHRGRGPSDDRGST
jgi:tRNA(Met) C34 N-acetyltransferase TmcA